MPDPKWWVDFLLVSSRVCTKQWQSSGQIKIRLDSLERVFSKRHTIAHCSIKQFLAQWKLLTLYFQDTLKLSSALPTVRRMVCTIDLISRLNALLLQFVVRRRRCHLSMRWRPNHCFENGPEIKWNFGQSPIITVIESWYNDFWNVLILIGFLRWIQIEVVQGHHLLLFYCLIERTEELFSTALDSIFVRVADDKKV